MFLRQCRIDKKGCGIVFKTVYEHADRCDDCISEYAKKRGHRTTKPKMFELVKNETL